MMMMDVDGWNGTPTDDSMNEMGVFFGLGYSGRRSEGGGTSFVSFRTPARRRLMDVAKGK